MTERHHTNDLVKANIAALSTREREVLEQLLSGSTNKLSAWGLGISLRTVEAYRAQLMERLGAQSLPELVQMAVTAGLSIKPSDKAAAG